MVLPVGQTDEVQQLIKIEKTEDGPSYSELCDVLFVPLVEGCSRLSGTDRPRGYIEVRIEGMIRTRFNDFRALAQTLTRTAAVLVIASCASTQSPDRAAISRAAPSATVSTAPDATGIVTYDGYQAAVARSGDTVASVARRIGLSASELGAYNGLSPTHPLQPGDELVLPPRAGGNWAGAAAAVPLDTSTATSDAGAAGQCPITSSSPRPGERKARRTTRYSSDRPRFSRS
jgi:LysM repeat protein